MALTRKVTNITFTISGTLVAKGHKVPLASLFERYAKHHDMTAAEAVAACVDAGIRRLAAQDRNKTQAWAGEADTTRPSPKGKGRGRNKVRVAK